MDSNKDADKVFPPWGSQQDRRVFYRLEQGVKALESIAASLQKMADQPEPETGNFLQTLFDAMVQGTVSGMRISVPSTPLTHQAEAEGETDPTETRPLELVDRMRAEGVVLAFRMPCFKCGGQIERWERCSEGRNHVHVYCPQCNDWSAFSLELPPK